MWNRGTPYPASREEKALNGYINRRVRGFGLTLIVMGLSFGLYYLGLFGGVSGPLTPENIGDLLVGLGVTRFHLAIALSGAFVCALTWNWVFNLICRAAGRRLTCAKTLNKSGRICGAAVKTVKLKGETSDRPVRQYVCQQGHKLSTAHFHPLEKGVVGHTVWLVTLAFFLIFLAV